MSTATLTILEALSGGRIGPAAAADLIRCAGDPCVSGTDLEGIFRLMEAMRSPEVGLLLRLDPPADTEGAWQVVGFATTQEDSSLLVPLAEAVRDPLALPGGRSSGVRALGEWDRACRLAPSLRPGRFPGVCVLSTEEAWRFLKEDAGRLQREGFGVCVPQSLAGPARRLSASGTMVAAEAPSLGVLSAEDLVRFRWDVALDGEGLSQEELDVLARQRTPLVRMRDGWVRLADGDGERIRRFAEENGGLAVPRGRALGRTLDADPEEGVAVLRTKGWLAGFLDGIDKAPAAPWRRPPVFEGSLRPYQEQGVAWLLFLAEYGAGGCLADDMGLGKTVQVLAALATRRHEGARNPSLVVCPTSVITNWAREASRFTPDLDVVVHHGKDRLQDEAFARRSGSASLVVTSYAVLVRDAARFRGVTWDAVVVDEAQCIKNPDTQQARAVRQLPAAWRVALTGTPVENSVADLWAILDFLNPGLLESRSVFRSRFLLPIHLRGDRKASARLSRLVRPFLLRRVKSDPAVIRDLPDKMEMHVACRLTREQGALYLAVVREAILEIERATGLRRKGLILSTMGKLRQVCNHPAQYLKQEGPIGGRSEKLVRLSEMLSEVTAESERALVFTQYARMGALLERYLRGTLGCPVGFIHGGLSKSQRDEVVGGFQSDSAGPRLLVLSLRAAGTGLNLTRASHVFHYDRWWNPAVEDQATDRAYRIGQTRRVLVYKLSCAGTIEEKMDSVLSRKRQVAERVLGVSAAMTELCAEDLRELLTLDEPCLPCAAKAEDLP